MNSKKDIKNDYLELINACGSGRLGALKTLLTPENINGLDEKEFGFIGHYTPLMYAVYSGFTNVIEYLIERGVDVNKKSLNPDFREPVYPIIASIDSEAYMYYEGFTPEGLQSDLTRRLINAGAKLDVKTDSGMTPLQYAIDCKHIVAQKIIENMLEN